MEGKILVAALGIICVGSLIFGAGELIQALTADPEERYVAEVHARTNVGDVTDAQLLEAGRGVCELLDGGADMHAIAESFRAVGQPADFAAVLVGVAVRVLCPRHKDVLE